MIIRTHELDMTPGSTPLRLHVSQTDADFQLKFRPYSDIGEFVIESGTTAKIIGTTPGGNAYQADATITSGVVTVTGNSQMADAPGTGVFELCLTHDSKALYSSNFYLVVETRP